MTVEIPVLHCLRCGGPFLPDPHKLGPDNRLGGGPVICAMCTRRGVNELAERVRRALPHDKVTDGRHLLSC